MKALMSTIIGRLFRLLPAVRPIRLIRSDCPSRTAMASHRLFEETRPSALADIFLWPNWIISEYSVIRPEAVRPVVNFLIAQLAADRRANEPGRHTLEADGGSGEGHALPI